MVWATHAAGALGLIFLFALLFWTKEFLADVSLWAFILAVYAGQWPDIDMSKADISKNPIVFIFRLFVWKFISWHRAKETHSIFWTLLFALIFSFLIPILGVKSWLIVVLWYFSHLVLDFFNPTGVKLFYLPFINSDPRPWSVNNFMMNIINPFKKHDTRSDPWIKASWDFESIYIVWAIWIIFLVWVIINFWNLTWRIYSDSLLLANAPLIFYIWVLWLLITPKMIKTILSFNKLLNWKKLWKNLVEIVWDMFNHIFVAQLIFIVLLIWSLVNHSPVLKSSLNAFNSKMSSVYDWTITPKDFIVEQMKTVGTAYSSGLQIFNETDKQQLLDQLKAPEIDIKSWLDKLKELKNNNQ